MLEERRNCTLGDGGTWRKRSEGAKKEEGYVRNCYTLQSKKLN